MRLLIYGAGVIGSLYAVLFSKAGYDTYIYARGKRLDVLKAKGLLYFENRKVKKANVSVISELSDEDIYNFIFLTVKENQLYTALKELKTNRSKCIVTMVNSTANYNEWEKACKKGKLLPAFPGAGGSIENDILDAALTPHFIQATTFTEISGKSSKRTKALSEIFKTSHIPYRQAKNMHIWQLCHLALVVPIADAYYEAQDPKKAGRQKKLMLKTARRLKRNFCLLQKHFKKLEPEKMNIFRFLPPALSAKALGLLFNSDFGNKFMYRHSMKAEDEMKQLHKKFYAYMKTIKAFTL